MDESLNTFTIYVDLSAEEYLVMDIDPIVGLYG